MRFDSEKEILIGIVKGIAKTMGSNTEVALHDLSKKQICYIENSYITGRNVGYCMDDIVYQSIMNMSDKDGHLVSYKSNSRNGRELRSSHLFIKDEFGVPFALICINQDVSDLVRAKETIDKIINIHTFSNEDSKDKGSLNYIQKIATKTILDEIERIKPYSLKTKEAKLRLIKRLDESGVFAIRESVTYICEFLDISQATFYNYYRETKSDNFKEYDINEK